MKKLIIIPLLLINLILSATNYYVKNGGSDLANGLTDGTAWATIAKVNASDFNAGDTIFFNRGDTWNEVGISLLFGSSGSIGSPIVVTAYGAGAKPIFSKAIQYTTWTNKSGNIYYTVNAYQNAYLCLMNGDTWGRAALVTLSNLTQEGDYLSKTSFPYGETNDTIYVYTTSPESLPNAIFGNFNNIIDITSKSYINFSYLNLKYSGGYAFEIVTGTHINIDSCVIEWCHLGIVPSVTSEYITISNNDIENIGSDGIYVNFSGYTDIYNNLLDSCGMADIGGDRQSIGNWHAYNVNVYNNIINHVNAGSVFEASSSFASNYWLDNFQIYNNYITTTVADQAVFSLLSGDYTLYNNVVVMLSGDIDSKFIAISDVGRPTWVYAYNNTVFGAGQGISFIVPYGTESGTSDVVLKNNIFYGSTKYNEFVGATLLDNYMSDYNIYSDNTGSKFAVRTGGDVATYTFDNWKTLTGEDANSIIDDPDFVDITAPTYDLHLQASSPAIGAGVGVGLNLDYDGHLLNDPPDVGAYAYNTSEPVGALPATVETSIGTIKSTNVVGEGNVTSDGGGTITARGVCYSTSANPTISGSKVATTGTTGSYTVLLPRLLSNTTYHVRAYVTSEVGTSYGADVTFTTKVYTILKATKIIMLPNGKWGVVQ